MNARGTRDDRYKVWDKQSIQHAIEAVVEEGMSIRRAALRYGIPKSTLGDRVSGRVLPGKKSGPPTLLTEKEEEELEHFLFHCSNIGYGKSRKDVMTLVDRYLQYRGLNNPVSSGWWSSYCRRHPDVVLRAPACLSRARYLATNEAMISRYFDLLEEYILELDLDGKPGQIFNVDELGFPLNTKPLKTLTQRGIQNPVSFTSMGKTQITVVGCVSASGVCITPWLFGIERPLALSLLVEKCQAPYMGYQNQVGWIWNFLIFGFLTIFFAMPQQPGLFYC